MVQIADVQQNVHDAGEKQDDEYRCPGDRGKEQLDAGDDQQQDRAVEVGRAALEIAVEAVAHRAAHLQIERDQDREGDQHAVGDHEGRPAGADDGPEIDHGQMLVQRVF